MDDLRQRVEAVERALTDGDGDLTALAEGAAAADRVAALEDDLEELREEVAELSSATQALRGYVGNVRSVNEAVEDRADAAVAAVESLEERVEALESGALDVDGGSGPEPGRSTSDAPMTEPAERQDGERCGACGQPTDRAAAADGGHAESSGSIAGRPSIDGNRPPGSPSTRDSLDGFDPNDGGARVTVRQRPAEPSSEASAEPTLVDRMRELL